MGDNRKWSDMEMVLFSKWIIDNNLQSSLESRGHILKAFQNRDVYEKICKGCNKVKSINNFSVSKKVIYGRHLYCRDCVSVKKGFKNKPPIKIPGEIWVDIKGWEGLYRISNLGRLCRMERKQVDKSGRMQNFCEKIMKTALNNNGYQACNLSKGNYKERWLVHRLVGIHFISNPEDKPFINHKNGKRNDPSSENLEWCTQKENIEHAINVLGYDYGSHKRKK